MTKYTDLLKDPRWQRKRLEIFERDNWRCCICFNDKLTLHIHHEKYKGYPWDIDNEFLKTVCENCHHNIHVKIEVINIKKLPAKVISATELLLIDYDNYNETNPMGIAAQLQWNYKNIQKIKITPPDFLDRIRPEISHLEYVQFLNERLNHLCRGWNVIIIDGELKYGENIGFDHQKFMM